MKACFQIFKAPFYFVGWLAPAYGKGGANSFGIKDQPVAGAGMDEVNSTGSTQPLPHILHTCHILLIGGEVLDDHGHVGILGGGQLGV